MPQPPAALAHGLGGWASWGRLPGNRACFLRRDNGGGCPLRNQDLRKERELVNGVTSVRWPASLTDSFYRWGRQRAPSPQERGRAFRPPPLGAQSQYASQPPTAVPGSCQEMLLWLLFSNSALPPFFLSPLQKNDGKPRVSVPWPFWEHSVQLPVLARRPACGQGHGDTLIRFEAFQALM